MHLIGIVALLTAIVVFGVSFPKTTWAIVLILMVYGARVFEQNRIYEASGQSSVMTDMTPLTAADIDAYLAAPLVGRNKPVDSTAAGPVAIKPLPTRKVY
jgi:uncharacterized membrane protein